jgi:hypothetical protein
MTNNTWRVDFNHAIENSAKRARRVTSLPVRGRVLFSDGRRYVAFDANSLLDALSEANQSRPGRAL